MAPVMGLGVDLNPFRTGMKNAEKIVKSSLGEQALSPFDRAVKKTFRDMKRDGASAVASVQSGLKGLGTGFVGVWKNLTSVHAAVTAIAGARVLGAVVSRMREARDASREYADAMDRASRAARVQGDRFDRLASSKVFDQLSAVSGRSEAEIADTFARFRAEFGEQRSRALTALSLDVASHFKVELQQAAKLVGDAMQGRIDGLKEIGVELQVSGDRAQDAEKALAALYEEAGGAAAAIANASDRWNATVGSLRLSFGEGIATKWDGLIDRASNVLRGYEQTDMPGDVARIAEIIEKLSGQIGPILDYIMPKIDLLIDGFKLAGGVKDLGKDFGDAVRQVNLVQAADDMLSGKDYMARLRGVRDQAREGLSKFGGLAKEFGKSFLDFDRTSKFQDPIFSDTKNETFAKYEEAGKAYQEAAKAAAAEESGRVPEMATAGRMDPSFGVAGAFRRAYQTYQTNLYAMRTRAYIYDAQREQREKLKENAEKYGEVQGPGRRQGFGGQGGRGLRGVTVPQFGNAAFGSLMSEYRQEQREVYARAYAQHQAQMPTEAERTRARMDRMREYAAEHGAEATRALMMPAKRPDKVTINFNGGSDGRFEKGGI